MPGAPRRIGKQELFARLTEGHSAGLTVVTPNQRLAAALAREFDEARAADGLASWEAADILPLGAFVERLYEDGLYSDLAPRLPLALSSTQERAVWERVIGGTDVGRSLLSVPPAASLAADAWRLVHAWGLAGRLGDARANDDARAFAGWARRYERHTERERHTDRARLPDVVSQHLRSGALRKPRALVAFGFDIATEQACRLFSALQEAGTEIAWCGPQRRDAQALRIAFPSATEELRAAAAWARSRLEAASCTHARLPRIGIVVPDLAKSRVSVRRVLAEVMAPDRPLRDSEVPLPYNISLGEPLADHPLVAAALLALEMVSAEADYASASRLIRSPFIAGAEHEMAARARLDAALRRQGGDRVTLDRLLRALTRLTASDNPYRVAAAPVLLRRLDGLATGAAEHLSGSKRPSDWAKALSALLERLGFPGERTLDSHEYQALKAWHEAIASFAALDLVAGRMRLQEACGRLHRIAAGTVFQPQAADVPIQVLGVLESAGLEFDHLWVTGLTDEAWPMPARANPLVPLSLQRQAGVPEAAAETAVELDRRITEGWLGAAGEVVLSHPLREDDRDLAASSLIRNVAPMAAEQLALPVYPTLRDVLKSAAAEERIGDSRGPALAAHGTGSPASGGGTGVFRDQAACPFRAFATHRLGAQGIERPPSGLDASTRGKLVHTLLDQVWRELKTQARLQALAERDLDALLENAADAALGRLRRERPEIIESRLAELEKRRLVALGRAWLQLEKSRLPFEVALLEQKRSVSFGGLTVNARLDRMDRLRGADGSIVHAILDYKTGRASVANWLGPRPDDPQIPLYAVGSGEAVAAAAFARVKAGEMEFRGIAAEEGLIPRVGTLTGQRFAAARAYRSWDDLLAAWRAGLEALGAEFVSGEARVDPKRGSDTCKHCGLHPLCRINERRAAPPGQE